MSYWKNLSEVSSETSISDDDIDFYHEEGFYPDFIYRRPKLQEPYGVLADIQKRINEAKERGVVYIFT